ncbi:hypothetical protein HS1genome_1826 [Sulfodiicoccus acidiphilus]|uniref:Uncharacterized protein n=1 Tax=Sulfodiicoccus acidiphilus TaxID=1670455 RepID=A0A348B5I5_9CREN|nr:hypothetical protein [Sulfodiicoccus acidiphilus]BBD73437.1 hypothetical protein HS1genome_1826 [Sulfodiicoccus acidiphilus]GGT98542.1 hypothetical protein GCM10007116_14930 [Sulfodiicoccus acidiphilus]
MKWPLILAVVLLVTGSVISAYWRDQVNSGGTVQSKLFYLALDLSSTRVRYGGWVEVNVTLFYRGDVNYTVPATTASSFGYPYPCQYDTYLLSAEVLQGYYTALNYTGGKPLKLYPYWVAFCPFSVPPSSLTFLPHSDEVSLNYGSKGPSTTLFREEIVLNVSSVFAGPGLEAEPLAPGVYTVVAWNFIGQVVTAHFVVQDR